MVSGLLVLLSAIASTREAGIALRPFAFVYALIAGIAAAPAVATPALPTTT